MSVIARTVSPLRRIFWGGVICVIDVNLKDGSFTFDLVNDVLGMILITSGVLPLARLEVTPSYRKAMSFAASISILSVVKAFADQWSTPKPPAQEIAWILYEYAEIAALLFFCFSMRLLCQHLGLERPARSWKATTLWFVVFYAIPLGILLGMGLIRTLSNERGKVDLGPLGLIFFVFVLPLIHLFVSTSRMRKAAEAAA